MLSQPSLQPGRPSPPPPSRRGRTWSLSLRAHSDRGERPRLQPHQASRSDWGRVTRTRCNNVLGSAGTPPRPFDLPGKSFDLGSPRSFAALVTNDRFVSDLGREDRSLRSDALTRAFDLGAFPPRRCARRGPPARARDCARGGRASAALPASSRARPSTASRHRRPAAGGVSHTHASASYPPDALQNSGASRVCEIRGSRLAPGSLAARRLTPPGCRISR